MFLTESESVKDVFVESPEGQATHFHDVNTGTIEPINNSKGTDNDNIPQTQRKQPRNS